MSDTNRRNILKSLLAGGTSAAFMPAIARALSIPAHTRTGTLMDIEHVVILTQENRAFAHYFGTLNGVQGFADRFVIPAADEGARVARTIFVQPSEFNAEPHLIAPFRLNTVQDFAMARHDGTPHGFSDGQAAWDNGRLSAWTRAKHNHSMGYFTREDIPFQFALAEAFTLCDAYHCALHLCTNPNRLYLWTGTHDPQAKGHGPALDNAYDSFSDEYGHGGYSWTTYPERLLAAGVSFQVYQLMEDNFGDNPLVGFHRYRDARVATSGALAELAKRTLTTRGLDMLKADVMAGALPQVSWIVATAALSEHPNTSSALQGADYTAQVLDALTSNPEIWSKTVLLVNFDENDGLFDHVVPPAPPARDPADPSRFLGATTVPADDEYHVHSQDKEDAPYLNRPYGLGPRVPMYVVSPWSRGGYVASEVFDHTSVIRFLEKRFGVMEPNISAWRRAVCGDLTSCFDFKTPNDKPFVHEMPATKALSDRAAGLPQARPYPPEVLTAPSQESGLRRRRPTPYDLDVVLEINPSEKAQLSFINRSPVGAVFHVYDTLNLADFPWRYTVGAGLTLEGRVPADSKGQYDLFILAPGGFHRRYSGRVISFGVRVIYDGTFVRLTLKNLTHSALNIIIQDLSYGQASRGLALAANEEKSLILDLKESHNWYDLRVSAEGQVARLAGHIETEGPAWSDPAAHGPAHLNFETAEIILGRA